tara:strand:- start:1342 stop:2670 length:1329 start_codon:yes stop_codon:yes gene_type:complete
MAENKKKILNLFYIFIFTHLVLWTVVPSMVNQNLPLDTIEALAWGSNLDWGFSKHPPMSAFFPELFFRIFGAQDWAYYLLSQIFVIISFYFIFKLSIELLNNIKLSFLSVLLLEGIYFYNYTTPEFNVNIAQLPFWTLAVYFTWKILNQKEPNIIDLVLLGIFSAAGFLSKYLFLYLLISIDLLFFYLIFILRRKKFRFSYLISLEVFLILLVPHFIWLTNNDYITIFYGLARTGASEFQFVNHILNPLSFLFKQAGILIPFFILCFLLIKKFKTKANFNDEKLIFLFFITIVPLILMILTSLITGSKIRTMWMTPFYLFSGLFVIYLFKNQINLKNLKYFLMTFVLLFFLSPFVYTYVSISKNDKRTDYPGKEIAQKVQFEWDRNFDEPIGFVLGDEWKAGNLSYHLNSRPIWEGYLNNNDMLNEAKEYICIDDICVGTYK